MYENSFTTIYNARLNMFFEMQSVKVKFFISEILKVSFGVTAIFFFFASILLTSRVVAFQSGRIIRNNRRD